MKRPPIKRRNKPRPVKHQDEAKRAWIRQFPCYAQHECVGVTQCCHGRHGIHKDDNEMLPGCAQLHTEAHNKGDKWIKRTYGFDWREVCRDYHQAWLAHKEWAA